MCSVLARLARDPNTGIGVSRPLPAKPVPQRQRETQRQTEVRVGNSNLPKRREGRAGAGDGSQQPQREQHVYGLVRQVRKEDVAFVVLTLCIDRSRSAWRKIVRL